MAELQALANDRSPRDALSAKTHDYAEPRSAAGPGLADSTVLPLSTEGKEAFFRGRYRQLALPGVGHFPMREAVASAVIEHFGAK